MKITPLSICALHAPRLFALCVLVLAPSMLVAQQDWPFWRGPEQNGIASADQEPPIQWSADSNVLWRAALPGRGHGSPIVVGDRVYIASADHEREVQVLIALDRTTGEQMWESVVHEGGFKIRGRLNKKASLASSTPAFDGERLLINFLNDGAAWASAISLDGKTLWQTKLCDYVVHQGYGSSPTLYEDLVIVAADNKNGGAIVAMHRETGEIAWRRQRPKKPNYPSPVVVHASGRDQLVLTGCDLVTSLDPATGKTLWEIEGSTTECVTTTVSDGKVILTSGGYPDNHISAVAADGSGKVLWRNTLRAYVPSMILVGNRLYAVLDAGIATCLDVATGEELWKHRLGGTFSSSPVLVGDNLYATSEEGITHIWKAADSEFIEVGSNQLGTDVFATPAICNDQIFMRYVDGKDSRSEYLACIAQ